MIFGQKQESSLNQGVQNIAELVNSQVNKHCFSALSSVASNAYNTRL